MDNLDFNQDPSLLGFEYDPQRQAYTTSSHLNGTWPLPTSHLNMAQHSHPNSRRGNTTTAATTAPLQTSTLAYQSINPSATLMAADWQLNFQQGATDTYLHNNSLDSSFNGAFGGQLQASPIDFMPVTSAALNASLTMDTSAYLPFSTAGMDTMNAMAFQFDNFQNDFMRFAANEGIPPSDVVQSSLPGSSPTDTWLEVRSLSSSDNGWNTVDFPSSRRSFESFEGQSNAIFNPSQTLHIRTNSDSSADMAHSAYSFGSYEEIPFPMPSPQSEHSLDFAAHHIPHGLPHVHHDHDHYHLSSGSAHSSVSPPTVAVEPVTIIKQQPASSSATSPISPIATSPPSKRKKSPPAKPLATKGGAIKKSSPHSTKKDNVGEKRVGRRRGPLRPEQRAQAHEIRKLGACLRCKFLKKTCDKGEPCGGCQPSHTRLWQVPCTRIDIKDIAYFMKDWKADYERHVTLGFSVGNIKGFSPVEQPLFITHGYGHFLPIQAREVYVRDDSCFDIDWVESLHEKPREFEVPTAKLSAGMEGISSTVLSDYVDRHIDGGFEQFIDEYFEGTMFLTEILKTAYRYYLREKLPIIRKALKLVVAYNLTLHVTMVEGLGEEDGHSGKIDNEDSKFNGKTVAPVMINFQVKCALADMWRELQKDILEELSQLYSSVYSGDRLKNWPTIFMLAAILLAVWEEMQFDCHYRIPDQTAVSKFCNDMESTPVGVIIGLFTAISQKLPSFSEWDTRKHHQVLNSNPAVCDAMTEVRAHVQKYESYLKSRSDTKFDRSDFDCLSNKFLSRLVIRAN